LWYLQKKGKTEGPIPDATLVRAIEKGDIGPLDLLFKEGEDRWRAAAEYREFQDLFQLAHDASQSHEDEWIILSKVKETKSFKQKGPFKTSEVKRKLKTGEVLWSDYAWREGMKEWYRVTALEIFHGEAPLLASDVVTQQPAPVSQKSALNNVEILQRPQMPSVEDRPVEADGPDLTQKVKDKKEDPKKAAKKEKSKRPQFDGEITQTKTHILSRRLSIWDRLEAMSPPQKWWISAALMVLIITSSVTALFWSSYQDHLSLLLKKKTPSAIEFVAEVQKPEKSETSESVQKPVAKIEALPESAAAPEPTLAPAPLVENKIAPTQIKAVVRGNKSENPTLEIQTNASSHFSLTLKISGRLASVIGARSFYKQILLKTLEDRTVDLKKYGLRPGLYDIQVQFDEEFEKLRSQASLEVATNSKDFKNQLNLHRKSLTHWATNERVQLIRLAARFDDQLADYLKEQRSLKDQALKDYYRAWQKRFDGITSQTLKAINARNRNNYVYADTWLELKNLKLKVTEQASGTVRSKDPALAAQSLQALRSSKEDLSRLKERISTVSLWK
jgi:hypothetical protein